MSEHEYRPRLSESEYRLIQAERKADIQKWLTAQGIEWDSKMLKAELLELC